MDAPSASPELMTAEQVAGLLLLPRSTVEAYARSGVLPSIKIGKHRRFVRTDLADFIDGLRHPSARARRRPG
ncbi:MAG: helix-turn-helix domain-containing protein [Solirubrobacteraceae bacterium]